MVVYVPGANETDLKKFRRSIAEQAAGRSNAIGTITLAVSAASTTVTDGNCAATSGIYLMPETANAAAALATTYIPVATILNGSFVIQHANNSQADRTFLYAIHG